MKKFEQIDPQTAQRIFDAITSEQKKYPLSSNQQPKFLEQKADLLKRFPKIKQPAANL
jgi:hypothetical protein